jgi:heme oxygenase
MLAPLTSEPVSVSLKHFTAHEHRQAEEILLPKIIAVDSLEAYEALLTCFYTYFQPVELLIRKQIHEAILPDIGKRRKAHAILADLRCGSIRPLCEDLPPINSFPEAVGALYVLEGSTLGGRGISKMLLKNCSFLLPDQLKFFNGYGEATGPMWTGFLHWMNELELSPAERKDMMEAANRTFYHFRMHILKTLY